MEEGEGLCQQVGMTLNRVVNIEEVNEPEPEGGDKGEEGDEEEEEEPEVITYKF